MAVAGIHCGPSRCLPGCTVHRLVGRPRVILSTTLGHAPFASAESGAALCWLRQASSIQRGADPRQGVFGRSGRVNLRPIEVPEVITFLCSRHLLVGIGSVARPAADAGEPGR
jgi:hypothetical protein